MTSMSGRLPRRVDPGGDRVEPRPTIGIGQRDPSMHLLDMGGGMKPVGIFEFLQHTRSQEPADRRFSASRTPMTITTDVEVVGLRAVATSHRNHSSWGILSTIARSYGAWAQPRCTATRPPRQVNGTLRISFYCSTDAAAFLCQCPVTNHETEIQDIYRAGWRVGLRSDRCVGA